MKESHATQRHGLKRTLALSLVTGAEIEFFEPFEIATARHGEIATVYPRGIGDARWQRNRQSSQPCVASVE